MEVRQAQNLTVLTPVKKQKGQRYLEPQDQWLSTAVSRVRQPIEALFAWIEEKTGIECASKVRSYNGLMVHVFGKLAAALFFCRTRLADRFRRDGSRLQNLGEAVFVLLRNAVETARARGKRLRALIQSKGRWEQFWDKVNQFGVPVCI